MQAGWYRWAVVAMLWLVCLFNYADRQAIFSVFDSLKDEMKLTDDQLGYVGSSFMWVYAAALPLSGIIGDRVNRKLLILGGLTFWSIVTLATAWATEYWHLLLCRALEGLGEAFYFPASMSLISDYHGRDTRSRAMGLHQSSVYAGTIAGGAVAGYCAEYYGWRTGFTLFGRLGLVLAAVLVFTLREPPRETSNGDQTRPTEPGDVARGVAEVLRNRSVLVQIAAFIGANFVAMVFLTWLPTFLKREYKLDFAESGLNATLWLQVSSVIGVLTGGWLADRWSGVRGGRMLVMAIGAFAGAPLIFLIGFTQSLPIVLLALCGFGLFKGLYDASLWASLFDVVRPERRATAQGLMNAIGWLGAGMAPIIIAKASQAYGMSAALSATSLIYIWVGAMMLVAAKTLPRRQEA
jgi:MFS family permease